MELPEGGLFYGQSIRVVFQRLPFVSLHSLAIFVQGRLEYCANQIAGNTVKKPAGTTVHNQVLGKIGRGIYGHYWY
ncbi:hypothetical protein [Microbulbifer sp. JMSA008]|uniref:hypothetical protein n=1 Tax=Microbulbifer sp. JMSA008 TaxID=3243373 RepID=UPI00403A6267